MVGLSAAPCRRPAAVERAKIDVLIDEKLAAAGLTPNPPADKRTLIRRATYDLTGLPPTPEEVEAFLADASPGAFDSVVDRLLASPHYGERWGRHWLDLVRYADTAGENTDHPIPQAWRYRNWVIDAFNRDLPYDEFVREQIAGDLLHSGGDPSRDADGHRRHRLSGDRSSLRTRQRQAHASDVRGHDRHDGQEPFWGCRSPVLAATITSTIRSPRRTITPCTAF